MLIFSRCRWRKKRLRGARTVLATAMILCIGMLPAANAQTTQESGLVPLATRTAVPADRTSQAVVPLPAQWVRTGTPVVRLGAVSLSKLPTLPDLSLKIELEIPDFSPEAQVKATVNMEKNLLGSLAQTFGGVDCNLLKKGLGLGEMGQLLKVEDNSTSSKLSCSLSVDAPFDLINNKFNDFLSLDKSNQTLKVKLYAIGDDNVTFPPNKDMFTLQVTVPGKVDKAPRVGKKSGNTFTFNGSDLAELSGLEPSEATIEASQTFLGSITAGNGLLIVFLLLVMLIAGAIGGGYFYYRKQQARKQSLPPMMLPGNGLNPGFLNQPPGFPNQMSGFVNPNQLPVGQYQPQSFPNQSQGALNQPHGFPSQLCGFQNQPQGLSNQHPGFPQQGRTITPNPGFSNSVFTNNQYPGFSNPEVTKPDYDSGFANSGVNNVNCPPNSQGDLTTAEPYQVSAESGNPMLIGNKNDNPTAILSGLNCQPTAGQPTEIMSVNQVSGFNPGAVENVDLPGFDQPPTPIPTAPITSENQSNQASQPGLSQPSVSNGQSGNA